MGDGSWRKWGLDERGANRFRWDTVKDISLAYTLLKVVGDDRTRYNDTHSPRSNGPKVLRLGDATSFREVSFDGARE